MVEPIPCGYSTLTPSLVVKGGAEAIEFYKAAFGAEEVDRMAMPGADGSMKVGHATLQLGGSRIFLSDEFPEYGSLGPGQSSPVTLHLYVADADAAFARAVGAGATVTMPLADQFWGDRYGKLVDPFGHCWSIGQHIEDVTPAQMEERMAAFAGAGGCE